MPPARIWCQSSLNQGMDSGFQKLGFATRPKKYQVVNTAAPIVWPKVPTWALGGFGCILEGTLLNYMHCLSLCWMIESRNGEISQQLETKFDDLAKSELSLV
jgi:hypothetical protein